MPTTGRQNAYDIAIIGGSLSGSSAALRLVREGFSVVVIDKDKFPRRKACGEGISAGGWRCLSSLVPEVEKLEHGRFSGYAIYGGGDARREVRFSDSKLYQGAGVERRMLDNFLMQAASAAGAEIIDGNKPHIEQVSASGYLIRTRERSLSAKYLIIADGRTSETAQRLGIRVQKRTAGRSGVTFLFSGVFSDLFSGAVSDGGGFGGTGLVHVLLRRNYEVCLTALGNDRFNVTVLSGRGGARRWLKPEAIGLLKAELERSIGFHGELIEEPITMGGIGSARRQACFGRALLVGDSCEQLDPIGGMGMTHALLSSSLAARALTTALHQPAAEARVFAEYRRKREAAVRPLRGFTRLTYLTLVGCRDNKLLKLLSRSALAEGAGRAVHCLGDSTPPCPESENKRTPGDFPLYLLHAAGALP